VESSPQEQRLLRKMDDALAVLNHAFEEEAAVRSAQGIELADRLTRGKAATVVSMIDRLVTGAQQLAQQERASAHKRAQRTKTLILMSIVGIGLIALVIGLALSFSVTRPLKRLRAQIDAVARGEITPPNLAVEGRDEVARIAHSFREMVQKAALVQETEARSKRLEALSSRIARAQEEERERIARELHDGLGQALTAIKLDLSAAARTLVPEAASTKDHLGKAQRLADESLDELRRLAFDLRPPALDHLGLMAAVESYARSFKERTGVAVEVEADAFEMRLPFEMETNLYRICQEALTNISRHAQASRVLVRLSRAGDSLILTVVDDGKGFDTSTVMAADGSLRGIGLLSMERRAEELGGRFHIESSPGKGTTVQVELPWNQQKPA